MRLYNDLKNGLQSLIDREDYSLTNTFGDGVTDKLDEWLGTAERRFYRTDASSTPPFELYITGTIKAGANTISIPKDFRQLRRIVVSDGNVELPLELTSSDNMFTTTTSNLVTIPSRFAREGAAWIVDRPSSDISYTIYYYGTIAPIDTVTALNYTVDLANYTAKRVTRKDSGTSLFFPTGTTAEQVDTDLLLSTPLLTPGTTTASGVDQEFFFDGDEIYHWIINNAHEILVYLAAVEASRFYDVSDDSLNQWKAAATESINYIVKDFQRLDGSGTTPRHKRTSMYTTPRRFR